MVAKLSSQKSFYLFLIIFSILLFSQSKITAQKLIEQKEFAVDPGQKLTVDSPVGNVLIKAWNENKVSVKIYGNKRAEDKVDFEFNETGEGLEIKAKKPKSLFSWFNSVKLRYEITVPNEFELDIETSGGDILISGLEGRTKLNTSGGDIHLKNMSGGLVAKTSGGNINVSNYDGNIEVRTSGGNVTLERIKGSIKSGTSGGDIEIVSADGSVEAKTSGGDIRFNYKGNSEGVYLATSGGDIDIALSPDFSANVELKTSGGDIEVNYPNTSFSGKIKSSRFEGKFNSGGESFIAKTSGGDITVNSK